MIRATLLLDLKLKMNLVSLNILLGELIGISSLEREQIMSEQSYFIRIIVPKTNLTL